MRYDMTPLDLVRTTGGTMPRVRGRARIDNTARPTRTYRIASSFTIPATLGAKATDWTRERQASGRACAVPSPALEATETYDRLWQIAAATRKGRFAIEA